MANLRFFPSLRGKNKTQLSAVEEHTCAPTRFSFETLTMGEVEVFVQKCWAPFSQFLYVHDICESGKGSLGRVYNEATLAEVLYALRILMQCEHPEFVGIAISDYRFKVIPAFWIRNGFDPEGTYVPESGVVHTRVW